MFYALSPKEQSLRRGQAKVINFAIIYGMGVFSLAVKLGISQEDAEKILTAYFAALPYVKAWKDGMERMVKRTGEIRTLLGRFRKTTMHRHPDRGRAGNAVRSVINGQIQGGAADIVNTAMTRLYFDETFQRSGARIVNQIHDELLIDCPKPWSEKIYELAGYYLCNPFSPHFHLHVPLHVGGCIGPGWEKN